MGISVVDQIHIAPTGEDTQQVAEKRRRRTSTRWWPRSRPRSWYLMTEASRYVTGSVLSVDGW